jgi:hypothetical protein
MTTASLDGGEADDFPDRPWIAADRLWHLLVDPVAIGHCQTPEPVLDQGAPHIRGGVDHLRGLRHRPGGPVGEDG